MWRQHVIGWGLAGLGLLGRLLRAWNPRLGGVRQRVHQFGDALAQVLDLRADVGVEVGFGPLLRGRHLRLHVADDLQQLGLEILVDAVGLERPVLVLVVEREHCGLKLLTELLDLPVHRLNERLRLGR